MSLKQYKMFLAQKSIVCKFKKQQKFKKCFFNEDSKDLKITNLLNFYLQSFGGTVPGRDVVEGGEIFLLLLYEFGHHVV